MFISVDVEKCISNGNQSSKGYCVVIRTDKGKFKHRFFNDHNGYYSHELNVYKNDEIFYNVNI